MKILTLDSSTKIASVGIFENNCIKAEFFLNSGLTHSQTLMPMIDNVLKFSNTDISEIAVFAVICGPGSFTGVRIGVSSIKGMAFSLNKPCIGVSALRAMAHDVARENEIICACINAKRNQIYNALFQVQERKIIRLIPDRAISVEFLVDDLKKYSEKIFFISDGAEFCYNEALQKLNLDNLKFAEKAEKYIDTKGIAFAAIDDKDKFETAEKISPIYLRTP